MKLNNCDIIFTYNKKNLFSILIAFLSKIRKKKWDIKEKVSHVALYIGDGLLLEMVWGGNLHIQNIQKYNKSNYDRIVGQIDLRILNKTKRKSLIKNLKKEAGLYKYSTWQVPILFLKMLFYKVYKTKDADKKAMTCSEYIITKFREINVDLVPGVFTWDATPLDLLNSKIIKSHEMVEGLDQ